jgi:hypothetical protein
LEAYHKRRYQIYANKQEDITELQNFVKLITSEVKHKKTTINKDHITQLIDSLLDKLDQESAYRTSADDIKDILFKDLTEIRALLK